MIYKSDIGDTAGMALVMGIFLSLVFGWKGFVLGVVWVVIANVVFNALTDKN